jgi:hypothetical protein
MYSSAKRRRIKPLARPTSFDMNVAFDIRHYQQIKFGRKAGTPAYAGTTSDESFQVMEGEILMQSKDPKVRRYGDHMAHVFSFANGLGNAGDDKATIMRNLRYSGVAVTGFSPSKDVFEQGFVLTIGGLNTLFNNGNTTLYPGDTICADLPPRGNGRKVNALQTGVPHDKYQFVVTTQKALAEEIGEADAARFIMGTALSYSRPGNPVDVVLHRCNYIVRNGGGVGASGASISGASKKFQPAESSAKTPKKKKR